MKNITIRHIFPATRRSLAGRLSILIVLAVSFPLHAETNTPENESTGPFTVALESERLTLGAVDASPEEVLLKIGAKTDVRVVISGELVDRVTKSLTDLDVDNAFRRLLDRTSSVMLGERLAISFERFPSPLRWLNRQG